MTSISIMRPAELTSLAPLSQLTQLQQIKLQGVVAVAELQHVTGLPISSLQLYHSNDDATAITGWLGTGAATKLQEISLVVAYRSSFGEALVQSLAQLPHLHRLHVLAPPASVVMPASDLQPLSSSTSLTALTLGNTWDAPINIAHLPSQLVTLAVVKGGLGNLGSSEDLARRLGRLTSLQLGSVTAADVQKLAVLTALRSLHIAGRGGGGAFSAASLQSLSTLSCLTHLELNVSSLKQRRLNMLSLRINFLKRMRSLSLTPMGMSVSTALNIITSSPTLGTLEVHVSGLWSSYGYHSYAVKSVSRPKGGGPGVNAVVIFVDAGDSCFHFIRSCY